MNTHRIIGGPFASGTIFFLCSNVCPDIGVSVKSVSQICSEWSPAVVILPNDIVSSMVPHRFLFAHAVQR